MFGPTRVFHHREFSARALMAAKSDHVVTLCLPAKDEATTVGEVLGNLDAAHPGFRDRLLDDDGSLRRFVNVFVADDDVRFLEGLDTKVPDGETVSIVPAVAGG